MYTYAGDMSESNDWLKDTKYVNKSSKLIFKQI